MPIPRPETPAQIPIARPRSSAGNTFVRIDRVDGMISAPPIPITARVKISIVAEPANAEATDPVPKISNPTARAYRRPNRSDRLPAVRSRPANTSVYESTIHWSWLVDAWRSRTRVGSATFRIVLSSPITSSDRQRTPRIHHLRSYPSGRSVTIAIAAPLPRVPIRVRFGKDMRNAHESQPGRIGNASTDQVGVRSDPGAAPARG